MQFSSAFLIIAFAAGTSLATAQVGIQDRGAAVKKPFDAALHAKSGGNSGGTQILYHGGPVMLGPNSVYVIYYGTFPSTTQPIINDFLSALPNSPEYGVNHGYNQPPGTSYIPLTFSFMPPASEASTGASNSVFFDAGSQGTQLANSAIRKVVANALNNGLTKNPNGVYMVVTAPDVKVAGFCNSYCAYHNDGNVTLADGSAFHIRYALIPDPSQRCNSCNGGVAIYNDSVTPNGDIGADTMTDDIMHELSEMVTDPDISAWYTQNGAEVADLCNFYYGPLENGPGWTLGNVATKTNKSGQTFHYNAELTTPTGVTRLYLIQQIWTNTSPGACSAGN